VHTGTADLPLHSGRAPRWLFNRMVSLAGSIAELIVMDYGRQELLLRVSDPYWFQAFSCVLGFDWHSSGTTTTSCGALKLALATRELGIKVAGGKGKTSRKTPQELEKLGDELSLSTTKIKELQHASRMTAKIDNNCIQDGFQLYHHCFLVTEDGDWAVVQQGMNESYARRYHWTSDLKSFTLEPHTAICSDIKNKQVLNMTARQSLQTQKTSLDLVRDNPTHLEKYLKNKKQRTLTDYLKMPAHHPVLDLDLGTRGRKTLKQAYELQPESYEELVALKGMGAKTIRALALISEIVHGTKPSWQDPATYSFAHGGKDGHPFPIDRQTYDKSIQTLQEAIENAKIGKQEKTLALKRLAQFLH